MNNTKSARNLGMAPKFALLLVACFALMGVRAALPAFTGSTNYWIGAAWADYNDAANWRVNDPDAGANAVPTANDMIFLKNSTTYKFDLNGQSKTVAQITYLANNYVTNFAFGTVNVTNGLLAVSTLLGKGMSLNVWDGGTFTLSSSIADGYFYHVTGGACPHNVKSGGIINYDWLKFQGFYLTVDEGATANINTANVYTHPAPAASNYSKFDVHGTLNAPNGIAFKDMWNTTAATITPYSLYTLFPGGTMAFGGNVTRRTVRVSMSFLLKGGVLKATGAVAFENLDAFNVEENAAVEFQVDAGASLLATNATYGAGSTVTKTGDGEFILGKNPVASLVQQAGTVVVARTGVVPTSFTMNAGTLRVEKQGVELEGLSFPSGYTLDVRAIGLRIDSPVAYSGLNIVLDDSLCAGGVYALQSDDAAFLAYAKDAIEATSGYEATIVGDGLKVVRITDNTFDATASSDLADTAAWGGGRVPVGEDVTISGTGTVQFTASSPAFKSIKLQNGATLSVSGGTLEEPVEIPQVTMAYTGRLLVEGGAFAQSTNGIDCLATADSLPVLEVATNATLTLQTPGLPKTKTACPWAMGTLYYDYGFRLYNVNLKWYGQIRMPKERTSAWDIMSQGLIGWAAAGDTTYIGLDCQGGTLYRNDTYNSIYCSFTPLMIVFPDVGGTVMPVGTLLMRDFRRVGEGEFVGNGTQFGVNSPANVRIPILVDGNTLLKGDGWNRVDGGADVTLRGPARWEYEHDFSNDHEYRRYIELGSGKLTLEDGGYFGITPTCYTIDFCGIHNIGTEDGAVSLCAKNSYVAFWEWVGNGNTVARIEDSFIMVGQLYRVKAEQGIDSRWRQMPLFEGFKSIEVPEGKTMWVTATNIWRGAGHWDLVHDWDRVTKFGPPITGGGNVSVTNALVGTQSKYSMTAIVTNSENTATGLATAEPPSPAGAKSYLLFADGANWAGTVVANGRVGLTNLTAEAAAPVLVTFGTMLFETNFPVRLWKSEGVTTNDVINITGGVSGGYGFVPELMDGYAPVPGDAFTLGAYPAGAALPKLNASHKWRLELVDPDGEPKLQLRFQPRGVVFAIK